MKVYVIRDSDFTLSNGRAASNLLNYEDFSTRYLAVFDELILVGRLFDREDPTARPVDGPQATFLGVPGYHGPREFLRKIPEIVRFVISNTPRDAAYILRIPATLPSMFAIVLAMKRIPFAVEVVADPYDGYSPKALNGHPLAQFFRYLFVKLTKWQCSKAIVCSYVTRKALQQRYPPNPSAPSYAFTSINLTPECFVESARDPDQFNIDQPHVILTGNMQKSLKGHDVLLKAVAELRRRGLAVRLTIIGYGESKSAFEKLAVALGIGDHVTFTGKLASGKPIRDVLDTADLFVLPSRQEGLPRALLEAMARGLPAIATRIGGTPELLSDDALFEVDDVDALIEKMQKILADRKLLSEASERNLGHAKGYSSDIVVYERNRFLSEVRKRTVDRGAG